MFSTLQEVELFFKQRQRLGMKPGLERIHGLLERLGNPEKNMIAIHIAGTNGKGSTLHFIKEALEANDYKVGVFTSPSFHGLCGHIIYDGAPISNTDFVQYFNKILPHIFDMDEEGDAPTVFEILTALAFLFFADYGEIILVEAGMGGRFDTTNSFQPILSIITSIAMDHTQYLGESLKEIASHKAGIIKQGAPVIIGKVGQDAWTVIKKETEKKQTAVFRLGKDFYFKKLNETALWKTDKKEFTFTLKMKGEHQLHNASLALMALSVLEQSGYPLNWQKSKQAIENLEIPGRFETIHEDPLVIIDAAHNPDGIQAFVDTITTNYQDDEKHVIVAMFQDKAITEMFDILRKHFQHITLTTFEHPRAWNPLDVEAKFAHKVDEINLDYKQLLEKIVQRNNKVFFITGSLHFITEVRNFFAKEK